MAFGSNYYGGGPGAYYGQPMPDQFQQMRQAQYVPQYMQQPFAAPQAAPAPAAEPQDGGITWVQGEEGAKAYMVAAGKSRLLMDAEGDSFYIKSTDVSGMPLPLRAFDYRERTVPQKTPQQAQEPAAVPADAYVTRAEFEAMEEKIAAIIDRLKPPKKQKKEEGVEDE